MKVKFSKFKAKSKKQAAAREIHGRLHAVYGEDNAMAVYNVYRRVEMLNNGRLSEQWNSQHHVQSTGQRSALHTRRSSP